MKKLLCILLLFAGTALMAQSVWFEGSFDEARAKAAEEDKMILIDFYSDG
jgi:hypothetical protein